MEKQFGTYNTVLVIVLVIALGLLAFNGTITGQVVEGTSQTDVIIEKYLSIAFSTGLENGINYGNVSALPSANVAAQGNAGNTYLINVSIDGNTNVDFCLNADQAMTNANLDTIPITNQKADATADGSGATGTSSTLATTPFSIFSNAAPGDSVHYDFWLDIDAATPAGQYTNTLTFKAIVSGESC